MPSRCVNRQPYSHSDILISCEMKRCRSEPPALSHRSRLSDLVCIPVDEKDFDSEALDFDLDESSSRQAEASCCCCSRRWRCCCMDAGTLTCNKDSGSNQVCVSLDVYLDWLRRVDMRKKRGGV